VVDRKFRLVTILHRTQELRRHLQFGEDRDRGWKDWYSTNDEPLSQIAISWLGCIIQTLEIGQLELTSAVNVRQL